MTSLTIMDYLQYPVPIVPVGLAARRLGVTTQRIGQLILLGKLKQVIIQEEGYRYRCVTVESLNELYHSRENPPNLIAKVENILSKNPPALITYKELALAVGLRPIPYNLVSVLGWVLDDISRRSYREFTFLRSASVINQSTGMPGNGFFTMAATIPEFNAPDMPKTRIWNTNMQRIRKHYS